MKIRSNTRVEIARFFACMQYGEQIARDCATRQSWMSDGRGVRFFARQARQEGQHARVFERIVLCISPRGSPTVPNALHQYRLRLEDACRRGDLVDSLVGQQIVLERLGGLILCRLDRKFDQRRVGFKRLRKVLLAQEQGHQAFGERMLRNLIGSGEADEDRVHELTLDYLALSERLLDEMQSVFDVVDADATCYRKELRARLAEILVQDP